jgi:MFS family permease
MVFLAIYFANSQANIATYVILAVLSLIILLVHPWTWGVFATTLLFTALLSRRSTWSRHCIGTLIAALVVALPVGAAAYSLSPSLRYDFLNTIQLYMSGPVNPISLLSFGAALTNMFANLGPILSPSILLLSLAGAYALSRRRGITANYLIAWIAAWCVGSILVAPSGLNPTNPALSETGLWRMLYVSPLPFLLALGIGKIFSITRQPMNPENSKSILSGVVPLLSTAPFVAAGAGLFVIWDPNVRLLLVAAALIMALLLVFSLSKYRTLDALIISFLCLLLFNAAFRSLFPLVLDPHNIFSSLGTTR